MGKSQLPTQLAILTALYLNLTSCRVCFPPCPFLPSSPRPKPPPPLNTLADPPPSARCTAARGCCSRLDTRSDTSAHPSTPPALRQSRSRARPPGRSTPTRGRYLASNPKQHHYCGCWGWRTLLRLSQTTTGRTAHGLGGSARQ